MTNKTFEASPSSPPRDLTVVPVEENPSAINLNWQPPKQPNGQITGYVIFYTTDSTQRDRDWVVEGVVGDKMTTTIKGLTPDTSYFIKIQARNSKGYGPFSNMIAFRTSRSKASSISASICTFHSHILFFFFFSSFPSVMFRARFLFLFFVLISLS